MELPTIETYQNFVPFSLFLDCFHQAIEGWGFLEELPFEDTTSSSILPHNLPNLFITCPIEERIDESLCITAGR